VLSQLVPPQMPLMHVAVQQLPAPLMSQVPDAHEALLVQAAPLASAVPLPGAATHAVPPALQLAPDPAQSVAELVQVVLQLIPSAAQLKPPLQAAVVLPHVPVPVQEVKVCSVLPELAQTVGVEAHEVLASASRQAPLPLQVPSWPQVVVPTH